MNLSLIIIILALLTGVLSNQCPAERTTNLFKSIKFAGLNSAMWFLADFEYDSDTNDFFYISFQYNSYFHYLTSMDYLGNIKWSKKHTVTIISRAGHRTLQYSSADQTLYYLTVQVRGYDTIVKVNSSSGNYVNSYIIQGNHYNNWFNVRCSLSDDKLAYFCSTVKSDTQREIMRFDTSASRIDTITIDYINYQTHDCSILAISNSEVFYTYRDRNANTHHIAKSDYIVSGTSSYSLDEKYHQTISGSSHNGAVSKLGEISDTIWHAVNIDNYVLYFQYYKTNFSLVGNDKYISSQNSFGSGIDMDISEGVVCILSGNEGEFLLLVNETTRIPIYVYDIVTPNKFMTLMFRNGYINLNGYDGFYSGTNSYHIQIPTNYGFEDLPGLSKNSTHSFSKINDTSYDLTDESLVSHSMSSDTNPSPFALTSESDTRDILYDQSYILSLAENLTQSFTVSPGQILNIDLPCNIGNFSGPFNPCETSDDPVSWVTVDCANSKIPINEYTTSENITDYFTIKSTYQDGELINAFSLTLVACNFTNCNSCTNGICNSCSTGYKWENETSSCELERPIISSRPVNITTVSTFQAQAAFSAGISLGFLTSLLSGTSAQDAWAIINVIQLILVLPLVPKSMNNKVKNFIASNAFPTLSIYFLPLKVIKSIPLISYLSFDQPNEYLRDLGWRSGSTLVNNFNLVVILILCGILHILFCLLYCLTKSKDNKCSSITKKAYRFFTFTLYLRTFIEIYFLTALMLTSEIKFYIINGGDQDFGHEKSSESKQIKGNYISLSISCVIFILQILFLLLTYISWRANKDKIKINEDLKTRELYNGIRKAPRNCVYKVKKGKGDDSEGPVNSSIVPLKIRLARLYHVSFLAKRLIMILIIVIIPSSLFALKISLLMALQIACIAYATLIRSFASKKDQIVEVFNEAIVLILIILLIIYDSEEKWSVIGAHMFSGIILFQSYSLLLVTVISIIIKLLKFIKFCMSKTRISNFEENQDIDKPEERKKETKNSFSIDDQLAQDNIDCARYLNTSNPNMNSHENLMEEIKQGEELQKVTI